MIQDLLIGIRGHSSYRELVQAFKDARPIAPSYDFKQDNTEEWKANSLKQEGFDLCLAVLNIDLSKE